MRKAEKGHSAQTHKAATHKGPVSYSYVIDIAVVPMAGFCFLVRRPKRWAGGVIRHFFANAQWLGCPAACCAPVVPRAAEPSIVGRVPEVTCGDLSWWTVRSER